MIGSRSPEVEARVCCSRRLVFAPNPVGQKSGLTVLVWLFAGNEKIRSTCNTMMQKISEIRFYAETARQVQNVLETG